jgi:hypothetical protein
MPSRFIVVSANGEQFRDATAGVTELGHVLNSHFERTAMNPCLNPMRLAVWNLWRGLLGNEAEDGSQNNTESGATVDDPTSCAEAAASGDLLVYAAILFWAVAAMFMVCRELVLRPRAASALKRFGHAHAD